MCHAPIVIPEVAGAAAARCARTTRAMRELARRAAGARPEVLVLISPHSPRRRGSFSAWSGRHVGDLADFRAPQLAVDLPDAPEVAAALGLPPVAGPPGWLDHGATVPLWFLWEAGWRGPTAILALPWGPDPDSEALGRALAELPERTAVIASGDMSHRLMQGAPAGFHPRARDFDRAFVDALERGDWRAARAAPWREQAAEDVVDSTRVAMAAAGEPLADEVLSYEGPWGVGYTVAVLFDPAPPTWAVARRAIRGLLLGRDAEPPPGGPDCHGVFVTLRADGRLRGCIGNDCLPGESTNTCIARAARAAATRDPRFPPVQLEELDGLEIEISLLEPPEPAVLEELDPAVYGVIVHSGGRRGVMLPGIEGITTAREQVLLTCRKVGIDPDAPMTLERFRVRKEVMP